MCWILLDDLHALACYFDPPILLLCIWKELAERREPLFWGLETWIVVRVAGPAVALVFALSLPISGVIAYRYWVGAGRLRSRLRFGALALTRAHAARRLTTERQALIAELERAKTDYLTATKGSSF